MKVVALPIFVTKNNIVSDVSLLTFVLLTKIFCFGNQLNEIEFSLRHNIFWGYTLYFGSADRYYLENLSSCPVPTLS